MENSPRKRMSAGVALVFLGPALVGALSGCNNDNCDNNRSTPTTSDDCGPNRNRRGGGFIGGGFFGRSRSGVGQSGARSGGFGGFGRSFGAGG